VIDREKLGPPIDWRPSAELEALLSSQRAALREACAEVSGVPQVGDIWLSGVQWSFGREAGLAAMLVVLRAFTEVWSSRPLFDVAPVSEDERLATEWSLILDAHASGISSPLVLHVDVQSTTPASMLSRRLGALSDSALADLHTLVRAYAMGDTGSIELRVGQRGRLSIRFHPEWDEFARQLLLLSQSFAEPLALIRRGEEAVKDTAIASRTATEASSTDLGATASSLRSKLRDECKWVYQHTAPFLHCDGFNSAQIPRRLGEAIVCYYSPSSKVSGVSRLAPQRLDFNAFQRLEPILNVSLTVLFVAADPRTALSASVGEEGISRLEPSADYALIVEAVRVAKRACGVTFGSKPIALAARRHPHDDA
jgi:mRNA-degrading endonuclease toxin of MazEF toxin-antitoxin module